MTANGHEFFTNNIYESFMDIYGHSRSVADKKNTNNSGQKNICVICVICATIKNQREEINQCEIKNQIIMKNKEVWKFVIQTTISILSAIATALGVTSCM